MIFYVWDKAAWGYSYDGKSISDESLEVDYFINPVSKILLALIEKIAEFIYSGAGFITDLQVDLIDFKLFGDTLRFASWPTKWLISYRIYISIIFLFLHATISLIVFLLFKLILVTLSGFTLIY